MDLRAEQSRQDTLLGPLEQQLKEVPRPTPRRKECAQYRENLVTKLPKLNNVSLTKLDSGLLCFPLKLQHDQGTLALPPSEGRFPRGMMNLGGDYEDDPMQVVFKESETRTGLVRMSRRIESIFQLPIRRPPQEPGYRIRELWSEERGIEQEIRISVHVR